ncbi:MAG: hypothetical protein D8M54_16365 [Chloroflexi bacterium]|nr:hypothetical protein [Chloroflexota bacterium]
MLCHMVHLKQHTSKSNGWLLAGLAVFTAVALFPYGWLADNWPTFDRFTGLIFGSEAAHVAGHVGLFVLLGTAVLLIFPRWRQRPALYFGLIATMGIVQEFLQIVSFKHRPVAANDLFDLAVDLLAAGVVFVGFIHFERLREWETA